MKRYLYVRMYDGFVEDHKFYVDLSAALKRVAEETDEPMSYLEAGWQNGNLRVIKFWGAGTTFQVREVEVF